MDTISVVDEGTMTIRQIADALSVSSDTIYNSARALFPHLFVSGKAARFTEEQVTRIKMNLRKNSEVASMPKTRLEKAIMVKQALRFQEELIDELRIENEALNKTVDPRIARNPIYIIRMKNKDGEFLYTEEECLRLLTVYLNRATIQAKQENHEEEKRIGLVAPNQVSCYKDTGRGRLFWIDSE